MTSELRFAARFDPDAFREDMARTTRAGRGAAESAKRDYEANGVPRSGLRPCDAEGRDGTKLPQCLKVYLPPPHGRFGMVLKFVVAEDGPWPSAFAITPPTQALPRFTRSLTGD